MTTLPLRCRAWDGEKMRMFYSGQDFRSIPVVDVPIGLKNGDMLCHYYIMWAVAKGPDGQWFYEEDIVKADLHQICAITPPTVKDDVFIIRWHQETLGFKLHNKAGDPCFMLGLRFCQSMIDNGAFQLKGNTFEHKELLEVSG